MKDTARYLVTPYEVLEWVWCPRFIYYWKCLGIPQYEENRFKVKAGRKVHEQRARKKIGERRKRLSGVVVDTDVAIESSGLGLRGKVDEVLKLDDETYAPVDFKFTEHRPHTFKTHRTQLCLYALLIESAYQAKVERGWIVYVRAGNEPHEVTFDPALRQSTERALSETLDIIDRCRFPDGASNKEKCPDCTYRKLCPQ